MRTVVIPSTIKQHIKQFVVAPTHKTTDSMMKIDTILTSLASLLLIGTSSSTRAPAPFALKKTKSVPKERILNIRGGDLGPISSNTVAKTFSVLAAGDAIAGTIAPVEVWKRCGIEIEPGKGHHYLGHGLGSSAATLAVTGYLATSGKTSVNEAIAFGILTRCAYMTEMLLCGKYTELDVPVTPHILIYVFLLVTAYGLLSGDSGYDALAKVVSIVLAGHGALLFLNPRIDGKKYGSNAIFFVVVDSNNAIFLRNNQYVRR